MFDPAVLGFTGYSLGGLLGDAGLFESVDASFGDLGGVINVAEISLLSPATLDALQPGGFALATLDFNVIGIGAGATSSVSVLSGSVVADSLGLQLQVSSFGSATVQGRSANVPVPGTLLLLLPFLVARIALRRT